MRDVRRREFIALLGSAAVAFPGSVLAQVSTGRRLVAVLVGATPATASYYVIGLEQRMQELGHVAGHDVDIVYRHADGDLARLPALADELIRLKPDVVVAANTQATIAARQATATIPIVAANLSDPVGLALVASHARPGGNVTGILASLDTLPEKQLALAAEVVRGMVKVGMLVNASFQPHVTMRRGAENAAAALAIKLVPVVVRLPDDLDAAFQSLARERVGGLFVLQDPMFLAERQRIATLAIAARLPTMFGLREHVESGGLMSYGIDLRANFRRAADFVDKILKGGKPADLPVELTTKFELVVNLKTAKAIGLTIPESFLARADEVIE
jgi:putative tryptophan/tyrosine transport system substrate-binding protein